VLAESSVSPLTPRRLGSRGPGRTGGARGTFPEITLERKKATMKLPPGGLEHVRAVLSAYMSRQGLRSTDQRALIVETFLQANSHVSIEELLAQVRAKEPRVGYATVYRTLKLLTECGVASERRFGDGLARYELADGVSHHDHLICLQCSEITEFSEPRIEELQDAVARRYGFELKSHKHELYGLCRRCLRAGPPRGGKG